MSVAWSSDTGSLDFATLRHLYGARRLSPRDLIKIIFCRIRAADTPNTWITLLDEQTLAVLDRVKSLEESIHPNSLSGSLPLFGDVQFRRQR